jgi:hypothetical protein
MITVEKSIQINKPVEEVFAYTTNIDNTTKWQDGVESIEVEGDPNAVGGKYTEVRKFLGREMKTSLEITAYEAGAGRGSIPTRQIHGRRFAKAKRTGGSQLTIYNGSHYYYYAVSAVGMLKQL